MKGVSIMFAKRTITLLLALLLSAGMVSCGEETTSDNTETTAQSASEETVPETEETSVTDVLKVVDYGGTAFQISGEVMWDEFYAEELTGNLLNDAVHERNSTVEEMYNIDLGFNIVEWGQGPGLIQNEVAAGDKSYDLLTSTHLRLGNIITGGYLQSWTQTDAITMDAPWYVQDANRTYSIGDNYMLLFGDYLESTIRNVWCMAFNKQKVEDYQIPNLYETVDSGKWTIDYLMNITQDIAVDLNGDGTMDQNDFYGFVTDRFGGIDSWSRTCDLSAIKKDENNYLVLDFYKESTVNAYELLYKLYYEHNGTYAYDESMAHVNMFATGNAIFTTTRIAYFEGDALRDMTDDFGILPYPKMTENQEMGYHHLDGTFSAMMLSVVLNPEEVERVATVTEALNAFSYELVRPALYDVSLKTKITRDEDSARMLDLVLEGRRFSFDSMGESEFMLSPRRAMRDVIQAGDKNIASYYATHESSSNAWIENIVKAYEESLAIIGG